MAAALNRDAVARRVVELAEWSTVSPDRASVLRGTSFVDDLSARRTADQLRQRVDIREGYEGLEIASTSFVGRVDVGPLRIVIRPKLPAVSLLHLLRFAYGLRDLGTIEETRAPTSTYGLHDLFIAMLVDETEELLHRGLARHYVSQSGDIESPRGRILVGRLADRGGVVESRLPCAYFERRTDWHLNQAIRAGLQEAAELANDRDLRRRVLRLAQAFGDVGRGIPLNDHLLGQAERSVNRLTAVYQPALTIVRLLFARQGLQLESGGTESQIPGFLFDMNLFFQRLLSRFLHENLVGCRVDDERSVKRVFAYRSGTNPQGRTAPSPRPDFALSDAVGLKAFLDAKYRDVWANGTPAEWLYQLSMYALSGPSRVSVLLYASVAAAASDQVLEVRSPGASPDDKPAAVIVRPVPMLVLAKLLDPEHALGSRLERTKFAKSLVSLEALPPSLAARPGTALVA